MSLYEGLKNNLLFNEIHNKNIDKCTHYYYRQETGRDLLTKQRTLLQLHKEARIVLTLDEVTLLRNKWYSSTQAYTLFPLASKWSHSTSSCSFQRITKFSPVISCITPWFINPNKLIMSVYIATLQPWTLPSDTPIFVKLWSYHPNLLSCKAMLSQNTTNTELIQIGISGDLLNLTLCIFHASKEWDFPLLVRL